jgi:tetratricopeptide (TPR) repeat protein
MGLRDQAQEDYDYVVENHPGNPAGFLGRWIVRYEEEQYTEALEDCATLLRLNPHHALAYLLRSFTQEGLGDVVEALNDRERATELNPALADIMLGDIQAGRVTRLTPELMKAIFDDLLRRNPPPSNQ